MKVIIAVDSFKGSLNSLDLGEAIHRGVASVYPDAKIINFPMADGGEGTTEALVSGSSGTYKYIETLDPLFRKHKGYYGILGDGKTVVIEMAQASGLPLLTKKERNPTKTSTIGFGEMVKDALQNGYKNFILGLGGSATNDGGMGLLYALGYKFYDVSHNELDPTGESMLKVASIDGSNVGFNTKNCKIIIASDVNNQFYGKNGAAHVFAKQKGADEKMIIELDNGLKNLADRYREFFGIDVQNIKGSGAAGGLGAAVYCIGGKMHSGANLILEQLHMKNHIKNADWVITGEGYLDLQSVNGKAPIEVAKLAKRYDVPVIALAGCLDQTSYSLHDHGIDVMFSILTEPVTLKQALNEKYTTLHIEKQSEEIFRLIKLCNKNSKKKS